MNAKLGPKDMVELYMGGLGNGPVLLSCEHASNRMPPGWSWPEEDLHLSDSHWAYDLGAAELTRHLADRLETCAVLANFSRLLVDVNRPLDSETLFRTEADGAPVVLNQNLSEEEREARLKLYNTYHQVLDRQARFRRGQFILSIHSFTPIYEGQRRHLQAGVLHVNNGALAARWAEAMCGAGFQTMIDEPYAGEDGFMFSVEQVSNISGRDALMLEIRNDLLPERQAELADVIISCLEQSGYNS